MRESLIESEVCQWAKSQGILAIKFTPMGEAGWPDRVFLHDGVAVFVEFKAKGQKPRPLQEHRIKKLRVHKFTVGVINNVTDGIAFLDATLLSGGGSKDLHQPSVCGPADGPRTGEDEHHVHGLEDFTDSRLYKAYFSDMPPPPSLSRVASPKG